MKNPLAKFVGCLLLACAAGCGVVPAVQAQTPPRLGLESVTGHPTLSLRGDVSTVYLVEQADALSPVERWAGRTLVQMQGDRVVWVDPATLSTGERYYRAVSVAAPEDGDLVFVSPGTFSMGSPAGEALRFASEAQHAVTISKGFWMGRHLVTQKEYQVVVGGNPSYFTPAHGFTEDLSRPVEQVSWEDATNYCVMLTAQDKAAGRIPMSCAYRLPTESEWEYACRAGTTTAFYLGNRLASGAANFWGRYEYDAVSGQSINPDGIFLQTTTPVESYAANPWGLYDMIGNVWEWCRDWYGEYPAGSVVDPIGPASGADHVARGGDWGGFARFCRSAQRSGDVPAPTSRRIGFRVVLALMEP